MEIGKWILILIVSNFMIAYISYQIGFKTGRDSTAQMDSSNPRRWVNKKWGYEVTFPGQWDNIKRGDASVKSVETDVFCGSKSGASTAIFVYPKTPNHSFETISGEVLNNYKPLGEINGLDKKSEIKNGIEYGSIIFNQKKYSHHYTIILSGRIVLMISSNAPNDIFDSVKSEFEGIVNSIKFF